MTTNPSPDDVPYCPYLYPNYKVLGESIRGPTDGFGFTNFRNDFSTPDIPNVVNQPGCQTTQEPQPYNPETLQAVKRNSQYYFRDHYQDYETHQDEKDDDYIYFEVIKNIHERNPLIDSYFSHKNVKYLQVLIADLVDIYSDGTYKISPEEQRINDLLAIMKSRYLSVPIDPYGDIQFEVCKLNRAVVEWAVPDVLANIRQYLGYVRDHSQNHMVIDRPLNVSSAGTKVNNSISCLFV